MTLKDDLLPTVFAARGIAGGLGFRDYTIELETEFFDASADDSAFQGSSRTPIVEGDGQPPRFKWEVGDDASFGNSAEMTAKIGPITPAFPGGGTDLNDLIGALAAGETRHVWATGPKAPNGLRLRIINVQDRPLGYVIRAQAEGEALKGL